MISIIPYQPRWPEEFLALGRELRAGLGSLALRIDHIGSTSVPGLAAKDIVDIQVTVAALDSAVEDALSRIGYERVRHIGGDHVPPGASPNPAEWSKWLFKPGTERRPVNLHVRVAGRANQRYPLLFRDYLRAHPPIAAAYAQAKLALAQLHPDDTEAYYAVKDPVCDIIMGGAEEWATATQWELAASDC
ncbi:MAG: GrpB family protein [Anaerolineae bacterium]